MNALALAKANLEGLWLRRTLNRTVAYRSAKLLEIEKLLASKLAEMAEVEAEYRVASNKRFSPSQSVAASVVPHSDPEPETDGTRRWRGKACSGI